MVVEVFLDVDKRDVISGEQLSDASSVGSLVSRNIVAVQKSRETSDIVGQSVELSSGLGDGGGDERRKSTDGSQDGEHLKLL
jgi:hypothetical protein